VPLLDIVVRAKNGHGLTEACIKSIRATTRPEDVRIILVDDGSEPPQLLGEADVVIRSQVNQGAVSATNLGIGAALWNGDAPNLMVLDNDAEFPAGDDEWLPRILGELEAGGPQTAAIGATSGLVNPPQHILRMPLTYTADWTNKETGESGIKESPQVVSFVSFAVVLRKSALREVGPWDEQFNPGNYEDTDYSVRLRQAGYEIRVARSVYIHHKGHATFGADLQALLDRNGEKFHVKHGVGTLFDLGFIPVAQLVRALGGARG